MYEVFFFLFAIAAIGFAVNLVLQNHPIHSAISLIGVMASLASLYLLLGAEFIAAVQVIIYGGAIMVLFVFVIMLLNAGEEERTNFSRLAGTLGVPLILVLLISIASIVYRVVPSDEMVRFGDFHGRTTDIGRMLFRTYLLPFEVVSILILVALVGAVVLARKES